MNQKSLANLLKTVVILAAIIGAVLCFIVFPMVGQQLKGKTEENFFWPWLIFLWTGTVPCYLALGKFWKICGTIAADRSFCRENAKGFKQISLLALWDSLYLFAGSVIFLLLNLSHPSVFLGCLLVDFIGFAVSIAAAVLSRLVSRAAAIQDENDLTI